MKINYKKLQTKNLYLCTDRPKPKTDAELVSFLIWCADALDRAHLRRGDGANTLGELWAADALHEIIDCVEVKHD